MFNTGTTNLVNTIVASNTGGDVGGTFHSLGHNLIGALMCATGWVGSDMTGTLAAPLYRCSRRCRITVAHADHAAIARQPGHRRGRQYSVPLSTPVNQTFAVSGGLSTPLISETGEGGGNLTPGATYYYRAERGQPCAEKHLRLARLRSSSRRISACAFISWNAVPGAAAYKVYGRTQGTGAAMLTTMQTSFSDGGSIIPNGSLPTADTTGGLLHANTKYSYRVSAVNLQGETLASTETSITTGNQDNTVTVNWTSVPGATGYRIYGRTQGAEQLIATVGTGTLSFIDFGVITPSGAPPTTNTATTVPTTDQRGVSRSINGVLKLDIGAFESQGFTLTPVAGTQTAKIGAAFNLAVTVTANSPLEPVNGGIVKFAVTPAANGASALFLDSTSATGASPLLNFSLTVAGGQVAIGAGPNDTVGSYTVTASTAGAAECFDRAGQRRPGVYQPGGEYNEQRLLRGGRPLEPAVCHLPGQHGCSGHRRYL